MSGQDWAGVIVILAVLSWLWLPLLIVLVVAVLDGVASIVAAWRGKR